MWKYHFFVLEITWYFTGVYGCYHLPQFPGNSCWDVNGKRFFGSSYWKIPPRNGNSEKVVPFSRLERSRMEIRLPFTSFLSFVLVSGLLAFGRAQSLQQQQQIWWVHNKWGIVPDSCCLVFLSNSGNIPSPAPSVSPESTDGSSKLDRWKIQTYDFLSQHGQIMLILASSLAWRDNPEISDKW